MKDADFWKHELFSETGQVRARIADYGPTLVAKYSWLIERYCFVTAFEMRKLEDAFALSEEVKGSKWPVSQFACTQPPPHRSWFRISEDGETWRQPLEAHYDLSTPQSGKLRFPQLCNYLVHHFAFETRQHPTSAELEILFNSIKTRNRLLYGMRLDDYIAMVEEVAYDQISWVDMDQSTGRVIQRRQRPTLES